MAETTLGLALFGGEEGANKNKLLGLILLFLLLIY